MEIKVCGPECASCTKAVNIIEETVMEMGLSVQIDKITGYSKMVKLGVLSTPAIIIDGDIKCAGKIPTKNEVLKWINSISV